MKIHEFTLILTSELDEEEADRLYSIFDDGTLATVAGVPQIRFHRETASLEEAIGSALVNVRKEQREYYTVGRWVPHCTLAFGLSERQIAEAVTVCRQIDLPTSPEVKGIGLVEVSATGCRTLHVCDLNL